MTLIRHIIYYRKARALIEKGLKFDKAIVFIDISDIDDALLFEFDSRECYAYRSRQFKISNDRTEIKLASESGRNITKKCSFLQNK